MSARVVSPGWRIALFLLAGGGLLAAALAWTLQGVGWRPHQTAWLQFRHSVYGLQVGAPVVLRGVSLGQVREVALAPLTSEGLRTAVRIDLHPERLHQLLGDDGGVDQLLARGLVARLATQSLLTGQLYVDLDVDLDAPSRPVTRMPDGHPEIPTLTSPLQDLQAQLQSVDLARLAQDISATAASARQWLDAPAWARTLAQAQAATAALTRLAQTWERHSAPLAASALSTLDDGRQTLSEGRQALAQLRQSAQALDRAAQGWQALAAEDSSARVTAEQALRDVSQAARAVRDLADLLERHPDAWWRGRGSVSGASP